MDHGWREKQKPFAVGWYHLYMLESEQPWAQFKKRSGTTELQPSDFATHISGEDMLEIMSRISNLIKRKKRELFTIGMILIGVISTFEAGGAVAYAVQDNMEQRKIEALQEGMI